MSKLLPDCEHLRKVIDLTTLSGNKVAEITTGWTKVKEVVYMQDALTIDDRSVIGEMRTLRHWSVKGTPHNASEEGFTCDECSSSIAFPMQK